MPARNPIDCHTESGEFRGVKGLVQSPLFEDGFQPDALELEIVRPLGQAAFKVEKRVVSATNLALGETGANGTRFCGSVGIKLCGKCRKTERCVKGKNPKRCLANSLALLRKCLLSSGAGEGNRTLVIITKASSCENPTDHS